MEFKWLRNEVRFVAVRSRGPGGQNVNKVSSAACLYWNYDLSYFLTEEEKLIIGTKLQNVINSESQIYLRSDEFRDLEKNKSRCLEKLEVLLKNAFHEPRKRKPTKPTRSSKEKKLKSKAKRGLTKKFRQKPSFDE